MPANDRGLPTARYAAGTDENCVKNTGENGPDQVRTAQSTHGGRVEDRGADSSPMQQLHGKPQSEVTTKPFRSVTAPRGTQQNSQTVALPKAKKMIHLRATENELKYLSEQQIEALFRVIKSPRDRAMFRLMYHRGLRASEPGLLDLGDWHDEDASLFLRRLAHAHF